MLKDSIAFFTSVSALIFLAINSETEVKKAIESFNTTEVQKIINSCCLELPAGENVGIEEIDWDINIIAGAKGL